jgi:hypothetical protein
MTKKKQAALCKKLKALYTKMDSIQAKDGYMAAGILGMLKESQDIECQLDKATKDFKWHEIYIAWEHNWQWHAAHPGEGFKPTKGRPKKLDDDEVKKQRKAGKSLREIAEAMGVSHAAVRQALGR